MTVKKRLWILPLAVVLALCALFAAYALYVPREAAPYARDGLYADVLSMVENGETTRAFSFTKRDGGPTQPEVETLLFDTLFARSGRACYAVETVSYGYEAHVRYTEVTVELVYYENALPIAQLPRASDIGQAAAIIAQRLESGERKAVLLCDVTEWDNEDAFNIADVAESNAEVGAICDYISAVVYPADTADRVMEIEYEYDEGLTTQRLAEARRATDAALDEMAAEILAMGLADETALYRAAHDAVVRAAEYDDDMLEAIDSDAMTAGQKIDKMAHGAAVTGRTVCTGYAAAYRELCGRLGLPCWVVCGEYDGGGHAWNRVLVDGEASYVDCTFDDGGWGYTYFMFPADSWQGDEHETYDYYLDYERTLVS